MEHNIFVIKSKSSNTAITSKPISNNVSNTNKKSWSSARFRDVSSKKRGMYVEKKATPNGVAPQAAQGPSDVPKAQRRPRRGTKPFLNSCLSILSKDTTATQFPEVHTLGPSKTRKITRKIAAETVDKGTQDLDAIYSGGASPRSTQGASPRRRASTERPTTPKQRKPRFRSRALSENFNDSNLVVIQPRKAVPCTPSINSSNSKTIIECQPAVEKPKRPDSPAQDKVEPKKINPKAVSPESNYAKPLESKNAKKVLWVQEDQPKETTLEQNGDISPSEATKSKALKKVLRMEDDESKGADREHDDAKPTVTMESNKNKKVLRIEEPDTLISNYNSKNKSLYNFFVDLLETTFNVYNVEPNFGSPSNNRFEIDETVAHKLKIDPVAMQKSSETRLQKMYYVTDDGITDKIEVYQARPDCCNWNPPMVAPKRSSYIKSFGNDYRSNLKSQSFRHAQQLKIQEAAKADMMVMSKRRPMPKRNKKHNLLSLLKRELTLEKDYFEEPENMHQALAIIARSKRRTRKAIHFEEESLAQSVADKKSREAGSMDCFKRRKIISSSTRGPKNNKFMGNRSFVKTIKTSALPSKYSMTVFRNPRRNRRAEGYESSEPSVHSIEVKSYDYDPNQYIRRLDLANKNLIYTSNSGVSLRSETVTSSKDYIDCLNKCGLSGDSSTILDVESLTPISQLLLRDVYNMY